MPYPVSFSQSLPLSSQKLVPASGFIQHFASAPARQSSSPAPAFLVDSTSDVVKSMTWPDVSALLASITGLESGLSIVMCFGPWDLNRCDGSRALEVLCVPGFAVLPLHAI